MTLVTSWNVIPQVCFTACNMVQALDFLIFQLDSVYPEVSRDHCNISLLTLYWDLHPREKR